MSSTWKEHLSQIKVPNTIGEDFYIDIE